MNELLKYIKNITKEALDRTDLQLNEVLEIILERFVTHNEKEYPNDQIKELLNSVVYLVFNSTPLDRSRDRAFVTGINWKNVDLSTISFLQNVSEEELKHEKYSKLSNVSLFNYSNNENLRKKATMLWELKWQEYYKTTIENENKNRHTWNNYLLKYVSLPLIIGVNWMITKTNNDIYVNLSPTFLKMIGLHSCEEQGWIEKLHSINKNNFSLPTIKYSEIEDLSQLLYQMLPQNRGLMDAWTIFHLIRSYAIWGGKSFTSIPVILGTKELRKIAVLSLCTLKPLDENETHFWYMIAREIFNDLMHKEIEELKQIKLERAIVRATYGVGHSMKNRLGSPYASIIDLKNLINNEDIKKCIQSLGLEERLKSAFKGTFTSLHKVFVLSNLLDILSHSIEGLGDRVFLEKGDWIEDSSLNIPKEIISTEYLSNLEYDSGGIKKEIQIEDNLPDNLKITPWIPSKTKKRKLFRPYKAFYEDMFHEIFYNALKHGKSKEGKVKVTLDYDKKRKIINITNKCHDELSSHYKNIKITNKLLKVTDLKGGGGLVYIDFILQNSNTGSIKIIIDDKMKDTIFNITLKFKSIQHYK